MAKIRVIRGGCGIEYTDTHGNARYGLKTAEDGPFLCSDAQAGRLVRLGVAAYVGEKEAEFREEGSKIPEGSGEGGQIPEDTPDGLTGYLTAEDLEKWDYNDLRKLAEDMGAKPAGRKKEDYIAAIVAVEVEAEEDMEFPELGVVDPE